MGLRARLRDATRCCAVLLPALAGAQPPASAPSAPATPPVSVTETAESLDSPRASLRAFVERAVRRGDYRGAARYLMLSPADAARGPELARRLGAVLERHLRLDSDAASAEAEGNTLDALPPGVDAAGTVPDGKGGRDTVFLVRTRDASGALWAFSRQTVSRIDGWYEALPDRWVRDWVPEPLERFGPGQMMWWQWIALPLLFVLALAAGRVLGTATTRVLQRLAARTPTQWDERLLARVTPALTLLWAIAVASLLLPRLALLAAPHDWVRSLLVGLATFAVFWSLWRSVDVWTQFLLERPWAVDSPSARSLVSVTGNVVKAVVAVGGLVATLAAFGYPVATVLAGLGIGGIAVAFGAQKTIENLFGSVAIAADQPFRVGDFVRIEDFVGTVERIGMRSTQIRTLDRTLVTLPNGKLADMRVEDFAARDRIRFTSVVSLEYGTGQAQMLEVVQGIERLLRGLRKIWPDTVVAKLAAFSPSSLDVEVLCWFETPDYDEFRGLRQEALLGILEVVERAGARLAFPTRTVHVVGPEAPAGARQDEAPAAGA